MADHIRRILRNYRYKTTSTSFGTILSESALSFFGMSNYVPQSEKMAFYGHIYVTIATGSTGGGGYMLPVGGFRKPGEATCTIYTGGRQHALFVSSDLISVAGGSNFTVSGAGYNAGYTNVLAVTLDLIATGGPGPSA